MVPIPLSLYIHIPWCIRKCPYCDFNSHQSPSQLTDSVTAATYEAHYIKALLADLAAEMPAVWGRRLSSIFIGGGTPSLFSAASLEQLLAGVRALLPFHADLEVTLEANPGTVEQEKFSQFRQIGINRLSIGIQSFNAEQLKRLGRVHGREEALHAAHLAREAGFTNFNLDLMFGLPQQSLSEALADLQQAIDLKPSHLSWYQLTLEPNTWFYKHPPRLPDDDVLADMQAQGQSLLAEQGYQQYEVSAYARQGFQCQHNRNYWTFGDYIAIGAGAYGKLSQRDPRSADLSIQRYQKHRQPEAYMQQALAGKARSAEHNVAKDELGFEFMLNALRLNEPVDLNLFKQRTGLEIAVLMPAIEQGIARGLVTLQGQQLRTTALGWRFLNQTIQLFLAS